MRKFQHVFSMEMRPFCLHTKVPGSKRAVEIQTAWPCCRLERRMCRHRGAVIQHLVGRLSPAFFRRFGRKDGRGRGNRLPCGRQMPAGVAGCMLRVIPLAVLASLCPLPCRPQGELETGCRLFPQSFAGVERRTMPCVCLAEHGLSSPCMATAGRLPAQLAFKHRMKAVAGRCRVSSRYPAGEACPACRRCWQQGGQGSSLAGSTASRCEGGRLSCRHAPGGGPRKAKTLRIRRFGRRCRSYPRPMAR